MSEKEKAVSGRLAVLNKTVENAEQCVTELNSDGSKRRESIRALDADIQAKQHEIDTNLDVYKERRTAEIKEHVSALDDNVVVAADKLTKLEAELGAKRVDLGNLTLQIQETKHKADSDLDATRAEAVKLGETIESLQALYDDLRIKVKEAEYARSQAIASRDKAEIEHEQFKKYEKRARAELNATDRSLQDRQADVATSEQFLRNKRSFLPEL